MRRRANEPAESAVLLITHGSRVSESSSEIRTFLSRVRRRLPEVPVQHAYLSYRPPSIPSMVRRIYRRGIRRLVVVPYFFSAGNHVARDIPAILQGLSRSLPGLRFRISHHVGPDPLVAEWIARRVTSRLHVDASILLVGRGSSNVGARREMNSLARKLRTRLGAVPVGTCYAAVHRPTLPAALLRASNRSRTLHLVPCLLFGGSVEDSIRRQIRLFRREYPGISIRLHPHLSGSTMIDLVLDRIGSAQ